MSHKNFCSPPQHYSKNYIIAACCTFCKLEIRTVTPSRFKNQTNDVFKLLGHNYSNQQGFVRQKKLLLSIVEVLS